MEKWKITNKKGQELTIRVESIWGLADAFCVGDDLKDLDNELAKVVKAVRVFDEEGGEE
jgi:hypothetical protein